MPTPNLLSPDQWVPVRRLAEALGESPTRVYSALYDPDRPMACARNGRAIRVRLCDWNLYWEARQQTVLVREPPRARRAANDNGGRTA